MAILLRKLTLKSKIGFGVYQNETVEKVIGMQKNKVLRDIYFNNSNITFIDEILETIGITEEFRIKKPGKNKELGAKLNKKKWVGMMRYIEENSKGMTKNYLFNQLKKLKNEKRIIVDRKNNLNKGILRDINHGHKRNNSF